MRNILRRSLVALVGSFALASTGCAAAGEGGTAESPRANRNVITQEEIAASGASNLYDVVQRLRPQWLRAGATTSWAGGGGAVVVYQNNTQLGDVDALRSLTPGFAASIRFMDGTTASNTLPGLAGRTVHGAIVISTSTPGN